MSFLRDLNADNIDSSKLGVDDEMLDLLYDVAVLGLCRSYFTQTSVILMGYLAVRPKTERARIGMGLLALAVPDYELAVELLRDDLLKLHPNSQFGKAFLGLAYKALKKNDEAKECFQAVINANKEPTAVELSKAALGQLEG